MDNKHIAILGLGLIGGSLAFRFNSKGYHVTGYDVDEERGRAALDLGAIDALAGSASEAVVGCDFIFVATPVGVVTDTVEAIMANIKNGAVVSDVGSVKRPIMESITALEPAFAFIGGHPMAGSEQGGIAAADPNLFENAVYVLTPLPSASEGFSRDLTRLRELIEEELGASVMVMDSAIHDEIVAAVSHMPHVAAAALVNALGQAAERAPAALALAAGGFRDTTRVASGSPELWADICLHNKAPVLRSIAYLQDELEAVQEALLVHDAQGLEGFFQRARDLRAEVPIAQRSLIPPLFDLMVPVPDTPGAISAVTSLLASANLSLKDIGIVRQREGEVGALRIGLADEKSCALALKILQSEGYRAYRR